MKVYGKDTPPRFEPVRITFEFDTQDELDTFGALFNVTYVTQAVGDVLDHEMIRKEIALAGGNNQRLHDDLRQRIVNGVR
jgi:hypothetical protein